MHTALASPLRSHPVAQLDRLETWKLIATYLGRQVRTVQRWECHEGLPVHRHLHSKGSSVYAFKHEIDAWLLNRRPPVTFFVPPNPRRIRVEPRTPARPKRAQVAVSLRPEPRSPEPSCRLQSEIRSDTASESLELCIGAHRIRISICVPN